MTAPGADPVPYSPPVATSTVVYPVAEGETMQTEKPGFFARLRNLFVVHKSAPAEPVGGCSCSSAATTARIAPMPASGTPMPVYASSAPAPLPMKSEMLKMPTGQMEKPVSTPAPVRVEVDAKNPF
jgi:hypothetical protein